MADANNCEGAATTILLRGPARSDWSMTGNANTLPGQQYVGTSDNKDVVFKSNGQERLRLKANGQIALWGADTAAGPLYRDYDGTLKIGPGPTDPPVGPCYSLVARPYWLTKGNDFAQLCPTEPRPILGTLSNDHLPIYTNGVEQMRVTKYGQVGIGTAVPSEKFEVHHTDVRGGMLLGNDLPGNAHSEIRFAQGAVQRWGLGCDLAAEGDQDFFLWDDVAGAVRLFVDENGKVGMGTLVPKGNLHVRGPGPTKAVFSASNAENAESWVYNSVYGYGLRVDPAGMGRIMYNFNDPSTAISITREGKVGIGYDPPSPGGPLYKFYVDGGIACRDVLVTIDEFQDKVFAKDYALMPLPDLRTYLEQHGHLPTMPKGSEVEANGGMEVGDLQMRLLRTVEEQALYILQLEERLRAVEAKLDH
ncbi:MAG: hypothetical protein J5I62_00800 [Flavobacteriales bacterium]|nr:hypothetical protein [Flavobacteriales bacterium]MEB2342842.1 hypothetical protein [Flavobacteriia bacterium]